MIRFSSAAGFAVAAGCLLSGGPAAADEAADCRTSVSELRAKVSSDDAPDGGDHKLLGGLSAETAGLPRENWFGSPPDEQAMLDKLDEADQLAAAGDAEGCRQMADEVAEGLDSGGTRDGRD